MKLILTMLLLLPLLLLLPATVFAEENAEENVVVYRLDFGPRKSCAKGYIPVETKGKDRRFFWQGVSLSMRDWGGDDRVNRDLIAGERGKFWVGLDNGKYEVALTFGDKDYAQGPCAILAQNKRIVENVRTEKGVFVTKTFSVEVKNEKLCVQILPSGPDGFAVTSMIVRGKKQRKEHSAYPEHAPPRTIPTVAEIEARGTPDPKKALKLYCDWLMAHRTESGFLNANSPDWYRTSYALRTLIAGYDIFGEKEYLDAAVVCLDKLVSEQLPNSAWSCFFFNVPTAERTRKQLDRIMGRYTNTADVGSISVCLGVAFPYVDDRRKKTYRDALKRYSDDYAAQWQLPSGCFSNGRWAGRDMTTPYSISAGTQGMSFCSLYAITGDEKYLKVAERAANYLLDNWKEDGRPIFDHHATDARLVLDIAEPASIGKLYYSHEAILWVWHWTKDEALKEKIRRVYGWHIKGEKGLLAERENGVWWPVVDVWSNSKMGAMPTVLIEYDRSMSNDPQVHEAVRRCAAFLCNPDFARRIGILCELEAPWGEYSVAATGFAGLSLAELVKPGVIFLKSDTVKLPPSR
jgi:hypothetical protein